MQTSVRRGGLRQGVGPQGVAALVWRSQPLLPSKSQGLLLDHAAREGLLGVQRVVLRPGREGGNVLEAGEIGQSQLRHQAIAPCVARQGTSKCCSFGFSVAII